MKGLRWNAWRLKDGAWAIGWTGPHWWFSLANMRDVIYLDLGPWRIRWARKTFRPLFSERYGHQKWHRIGRLAAHRAKRRVA